MLSSTGGLCYLCCTVCGAGSTPAPGSCLAGYRACCWRESQPLAASGPGRCSSCGAGMPLWGTPRWRSCPVDSDRTQCRSPAFLEEMNHIFTFNFFLSHMSSVSIHSSPCVQNQWKGEVCEIFVTFLWIEWFFICDLWVLQSSDLNDSENKISIQGKLTSRTCLSEKIVSLQKRLVNCSQWICFPRDTFCKKQKAKSS